jgi:hypothetical protein
MDVTILSPALRRLARRGRLRWRAWVAYGVLAGFVLPSLGPLPWIAQAAALHHFHVAGLDPHDEPEPASPRHHDQHGGFAPDQHLEGDALLRHHLDDAAQIPGSPTHPIDHDCAECLVLNDLAHCAFVDPGIPEVPPPLGAQVQPGVPRESQHTPPLAALPPARAPPTAPPGNLSDGA